ncbi:MAG: PAC2 family protein [Micrococcaceae bacterium]
MDMDGMNSLFYLDDSYKKHLPQQMPDQVTLIYLISGFGDAGEVSDVVSKTILGTLEHHFIGEFIMDDLVNYRAKRPRMVFSNNKLRDFQAPALELYLVFDDAGVPFYLLAGQEPDFRWEQFCETVIDIVETLDIDQVNWLHSIPMPVPHTRPAGMYLHGNYDMDEKAKEDKWSPTIIVPSSAAHLLELRLGEAGIKVGGFAMQVPHYIAENAYTPAAVSAFEILSSMTSLMFNTDDLRDRSRDMEFQINKQVEESEEIKRVVEALEENYDKISDDDQFHPIHLLSEETLPTAEEITEELERYMENKRSDD